VYGRRFGIEHETALRIGSGFASGMRMAETCGAVTGAFMVLGLAHATSECNVVKGRQPVYAALTQFRGMFEARNKTVVCRDLLGCDPTTPEGAQLAKERGLFKTTCLKMVRDTAEILERMLEGVSART
jgi:C_GCAxxG_C_C family probable redox protein